MNEYQLKDAITIIENYLKIEVVGIEYEDGSKRTFNVKLKEYTPQIAFIMIDNQRVKTCIINNQSCKH